jgi:hypothetical protein
MRKYLTVLAAALLIGGQGVAFAAPVSVSADAAQAMCQVQFDALKSARSGHDSADLLVNRSIIDLMKRGYAVEDYATTTESYRHDMKLAIAKLRENHKAWPDEAAFIRAMDSQQKACQVQLMKR